MVKRIVGIMVLAALGVNAVEAHQHPGPLPCIHSSVTLSGNGTVVYWDIALPPGLTDVQIAPRRPTGRWPAALWTPVRSGAARLERNIVMVNSLRLHHLRLKMVVRGNLRRLDRTYAPYFRFADGTVAVLSNDFWLRAGGFHRSCLTFMAPKGAKVFANDEESARSIRLDSPWSGYVAFGRPLTFKTAHNVIIQDKALPAWIGTSLRDRIGQISNFYASKLGFRRIPEMFIFSAARDSGPHAPSGFHADVLPGSMTFNFFGPDWAVRQPAAVNSVIGLLAHELFHVWNRNLDHWSPGNLLVVEGGAQLARALVEHKFESAQRPVLKQVSGALNRCLNELSPDRSLASQLRRAPRLLPYECGLPFVLATVKTGRHSKSLQEAFFAAWRSALGHTGRHSYDWKALIGPDTRGSVAAGLRQAISVRGGYVSNLRTEFREDGYDLAPVAAPSRRQRQAAARRLMQELMASNCRGAVSMFVKYPRGFLIARLPSGRRCEMLRANDFVVKIQGQSPWPHPFALSKSVAKACTARGSVGISLEGDPAEAKMMCSAAVHAIARPVALHALIVRQHPCCAAARGSPAT